MAFGGAVKLPAALQWLSSIAWDALVGLFGGEALAVLLGIPFWTAVLIVLGVQGVVGFYGYEVIHRLQAVLTVVLFITFVVFAIKLVGGHDVVTPPTVHGADLAGAFVLEVTIALSLTVSWASYASDFSRYLPADTSRRRVFGYTFAGIVLAYAFVQGIGVAAGELVSEQTAEGVRSVMGGGVLGGLALLVIALASVGSGVMNDYSGSLALQTLGVRVRRPLSSVVVTVLAFGLILWLHSADTAARFQNVLLVVSYWIPAFVAVVVVD
jgi:NCS1 family nucleobase:cation symporter-1